MKIQPGDKVRFLNATGGGIVARCENGIVYVEDADGFEFPTAENEVVLIESAAEQKKPAPEKKPAQPAGPPEIVPDDDYSFADDASADDDPHFALAFLRSDKGNSGMLDLFAVNDSNYFVFFTLAEAKGEQKHLQHFGIIEPNTKLMLGKCDPRRIDGCAWHCSLILFKKGKDYRPQPAVEETIKIKSTRFFHENSFTTNNYFDAKALICHIIKDKLSEKLGELAAADLHKAAEQKERNPAKPVSKSSKTDTIEVDLHITELIDDTTGMSNGEMLQMQIARFRHVMETYIGHKGQRIVFIHGVGNGVLKAELRKILDREYKKVYYQDASFREYGFGATMVEM